MYRTSYKFYHFILQDLSRYKSAIPHLVAISGRQETAVQQVIDELKSRPIDPEELALLHIIHSKNTSGHLGRGYVILGKVNQNILSHISDPRCLRFLNWKKQLLKLSHYQWIVNLSGNNNFNFSSAFGIESFTGTY